MTAPEQYVEFMIFVTCIDNEGSLLRLHGHLDKRPLMHIDEMLRSITDCLNSTQEPKPSMLYQNMLCFVKTQDNRYYRGKICKAFQEGTVLVNLIDYGNLLIVPFHDIRILDGKPEANILQIPVSLQTFILTGTAPTNGWQQEQINAYNKTLVGKDVKAAHLGQVENYQFIKLMHKGVDFSRGLIEKKIPGGVPTQNMYRVQGYAVKNMPHMMVPRTMTDTCQTVHDMRSQMNVQTQYQQMRNNGWHNSVQQQQPPSMFIPTKPQLQSPPPAEANVFRSRVLDIGATYKVSVSYVDEGPLKFSVQIEDTMETLGTLMNELQQYEVQPLEEPPIPGSVCLGRYTHDRVLCRAVVMALTESKVKVYYVDFGHTEFLPYSDIYQLPAKYINPKVLSIRFTLSGIRNWNITEEVKTYFKEYVANKTLVLKVCPPEGPPLIQYGDLYDEGRDMKDILLTKFPYLRQIVTYQPPASLHLAQRELIHVAYIESCYKFFVQLDKDMNALESLRNEITEVAKTAQKLIDSQLMPGMPCIALYETDGQWYRAQIQNIMGDKVKVLYIDYGNEEIVFVNTLRMISKELVSQLRSQAIRCILKGFESPTVDKEISKQFERLAMEKPLTVSIEQCSKNGYVVELYDPDTGIALSSQLKPVMLQRQESPIKTFSVSGVQHERNNEMSKSQTLRNQRSDVKERPALARKRPKIKSVKSRSDDNEEWRPRNKTDYNKSFEKSYNGDVNDRGSKTWKNDENEQRFDNRLKKSNTTDDRQGLNERFGKGSSREERSFRDDFRDDRFTRKEPYSKGDYDEENTFRSGRDFRNIKSAPRYSANKHDRSFGSDNSSDKDSDTFYGKGNRRGSQSSRRDSGSSGGRPSSKWNRDKEQDYYRGRKYGEDGNASPYKSTKPNAGYGKCKDTNKTVTANIHEQDAKNCAKSKSTIPPTNVTVGTTSKCEVAYFVHPSQVYLHMISKSAELKSVMDKIASMCASKLTNLPEFKIKTETACIAQYSEDQIWYRAIIKSIKNSKATVFFVDYGNSEEVDFDLLKEIAPDIADVPVQAICCKMLGVKKLDWSVNEIDTFANMLEGKILEVEFVTKDNDVYEVLVRQEGSTEYVNEHFAQGVNLTEMKELAKKKTVSFTQVQPAQNVIHSYMWSSFTFQPGTKEKVIITWFVNPRNFYCQVKNSMFRQMMEQLQKAYVGRKPITGTLKSGACVIAIFAEDRAFYRAEVIEPNKFNSYLIRYIDFGNTAIVDQNKIYAVEEQFMKLPKQAFKCALKDAMPSTENNWPKLNSPQMDECFNKDEYECTFHEFNDSMYEVSLHFENSDVIDMLIEKGLASRKTAPPVPIIEETTVIPKYQEVPKIDISLLVGQTLLVKVSCVNNIDQFYIQFSSADACENIISQYMSGKDDKVMPRLLRHEVCLGAGCLVKLDGMWRRAVVVNNSKTADFGVKLIDTGAYHEILLDCMLVLPGQLAAMQNQAFECSLCDTEICPEATEKLKTFVKDKEVVIHVKELNNNRLVVQLYDKFGTKFSVTDTESVNTICLICPMPILHPTHKVMMSYVNHSGSLWLQKVADIELRRKLLNEMNEYYSTSGESMSPKINSLCAALCPKRNYWLRAKILNITDDGVYIHYIDHGTDKVVPMESIKVLDTRFYTPYQLAIEVSLTVTVKGTKAEQQQILMQYLHDQKCDGTFYNVHGKWFVELVVNNEKLSERLNADGLIAECKVAEPDTVIESDTVIEKKKIESEDLTVGAKYDVTVLHSDSPSQFWVIRKECYETLQIMQNELQNAVANFSEITEVPEVGTLCAVQYMLDERWYRAEVLDADEDITTVRFIDYGITDVNDNSKNKILQLSDNFLHPKGYAIQCKLDLVPAQDEEWSSEACHRFQELAMHESFVQALVIADGIPKRIDILNNDKSINDILLQEGFAAKVPHESNLLEDMMEEELDPHSAFICHFESLNTFWIQETKHIGDLETISDRLLVADMQPKVNKIKEGMLCVAEFPDDGKWYRAVVTKPGEGQIQVRYIDYGNSAMVSDVRIIPDDVAAYPIMSRKCALKLPVGYSSWPKGADEEFENLAQDGATVFLPDILEEVGDTSIVKLFLDKRDVADIIMTRILRNEQQPIQTETVNHEASQQKTVNDRKEIEEQTERLPPLGEENVPNVIISHIQSLSKFWIQMENDIPELEIMEERLANTGESFVPLTTFESGTVCAAQYPNDGRWYRAKIISHDEDIGTKVLYIDYGNSETTTQLKKLPEDIVDIPALSQCCALQMPEGVADWSPAALDKFLELAAEGATMFQYEVTDKEVSSYVNLRLDGNDVSEILATLCNKENAKVVEADRHDDKLFTLSEESQEKISLTEETTEGKNDETGILTNEKNSTAIMHDSNNQFVLHKISSEKSKDLHTSVYNSSDTYVEDSEINKSKSESSLASDEPQHDSATFKTFLKVFPEKTVTSNKSSDLDAIKNSESSIGNPMPSLSQIQNSNPEVETISEFVSNDGNRPSLPQVENINVKHKLVDNVSSVTLSNVTLVLNQAEQLSSFHPLDAPERHHMNNEKLCGKELTVDEIVSSMLLNESEENEDERLTHSSGDTEVLNSSSTEETKQVAAEGDDQEIEFVKRTTTSDEKMEPNNNEEGIVAAVPKLLKTSTELNSDKVHYSIAEISIPKISACISRDNLPKLDDMDLSAITQQESMKPQDSGKLNEAT